MRIIIIIHENSTEYAQKKKKKNTSKFQYMLNFHSIIEKCSKPILYLGYTQWKRYITEKNINLKNWETEHSQIFEIMHREKSVMTKDNYLRLNCIQNCKQKFTKIYKLQIKLKLIFYFKFVLKIYYFSKN